MKKVLIAVDGSNPAKSAIATVASVTRAGLSPSVVLVNVRTWPIIYGEASFMSLEQIEKAEREYQQALLAEAEAQALAAGLAVTGKMALVGEPASEIVRAAEECGADQIAMGTHGRGALGNLFIGSVAQRVVHLSKVPVLLCK